jgi:hypothetical protein
MSFRPTVLERAFELARSGDYAGVSEVRDQLAKEGFSTAQITGPTLMRQLRTLCTDASSAKDPEPPAATPA